MDQVVDKEAEIDRKFGAEIVDENLYYGKRYTDDQWAVKRASMKQYVKDMVANSNLPEQIKRVFAATKVDVPGIVVSATNTELTNSLRSGFANLNFENEDELQTFFKQYQDWMEPAYLEIHGGSGKFAKEHLAGDLVFYKNHYKSLMSSVLTASVSHVDMQI